MRKEDRKNNHIGKQIIPGLFVGGEEAAINEQWITEEKIGAIVNVTNNIPNFFEGFFFS